MFIIPVDVATVEPLSNGHVGTSHFGHFREVVLSSKVKEMIGKLIIGASKCYCIVSFIWSVLYQISRSHVGVISPFCSHLSCRSGADKLCGYPF